MLQGQSRPNAVSAAMSPAAASEETVEETFVVDGPAVLDRENVFGDVTVKGGARDPSTSSGRGEVQVIARLSL